MRDAIDGIKKIPHPEEAAERLSRRTHRADPAHARSRGWRKTRRQESFVWCVPLVVNTKQLVRACDHRDCFASLAMTPQMAVIARSGDEAISMRGSMAGVIGWFRPLSCPPFQV